MRTEHGVPLLGGEAAAVLGEAEGPVHIERLARLVAASFGLRRLHAQREKQIVNQFDVLGKCH